ncbi:MAG: hypothetical protein IIW26_02655 [Tidjanibacter sp.]|jgi:uncharacterized protein YneF (UPF0154 family)|nr:hypothetical protein [Tidjanibacter sp.]MBQ5807327.1 hypothetical protein [Tidjanibacter sp.]
MSSILVVIIASIIVVAFFFVGLGLTRMVKGHDIQSEISTNPHMQERGIKCAMQQEREAQLEAMGKDGCDTNVDCNGECSACGAVAKK